MFWLFSSENQFMLPTVSLRAIRVNEKEAVANEKKRVIVPDFWQIERGLGGQSLDRVLHSSLFCASCDEWQGYLTLGMMSSWFPSCCEVSGGSSERQRSCTLIAFLFVASWCAWFPEAMFCASWDKLEMILNWMVGEVDWLPRWSSKSLLSGSWL